MADQSHNIRVRIAPSPTGPLHVGTARTALFNAFFARRNRGTFILRIEDTDPERSKKKWEEDIVQALAWLGIEWDEGPTRQSERKNIHITYLNRLLESGDAFYCAHTKDELGKEKHAHTCKDRENPPARGEIIRFKNPGGDVTFSDIIRGDITFDAGLLGDFSIARSANDPLYNFAVTIDDAEMRISHVIRGEDHISNTPKQILIIRALGLIPPSYAHVPLVLGPDRSKLSKRHGAVSLLEYRDIGYLPDAMVNFLALLGWHPKKDATEILTRDRIEKQFDLDDIQRSGAIFDMQKLNSTNATYIRALSIEKLTDFCIPYLQKAKFDVQNRAYVERVVTLEQDRLVVLSDIVEKTRFFFEDTVQYDWELLLWKDMGKDALRRALETLKTLLEQAPEDMFSSTEKLQGYLMPHAEKEGDKGILLWPLRALLSGKEASPGPFDILAILGKKRALERVGHAMDILP